MKRIILFFLFFTMTLMSNAQVTEMPSYEKKKPWSTDVSLSLVGTADKDVMIYLAVSGSYDFNAETYLEYKNPSSGSIERVYMTDSRRLTDGNAIELARYGYHSLVLTFPPLPNGVNRFDLISPKIKLWGISIRPVDIKPPKKTMRMAETEEEIQALVDATKLSIAGYYEYTESGMTYAVVQKDNSIYVVFVKDNNGENDNWKCGEIRGTLRPTSLNNVYKATWLLNSKDEWSAVIAFDSKSMTLTAKHPLTDEDVTDVYVRMGSNNNGNDGEIAQGEVWSGTGFALADGYLVTNYHVAGEASEIQVKGINGDINTGYKAELVASDKVNDIAIVRIVDDNFKGFGNITYSISPNMANVGVDVFVLGYPLTQTLGNEIKLTNGIVSSRTGYQGNIATYQISAPIQPGNSGGPMFDIKGNVIGIVVAGVPGAENVGYAIKTSYLKILIESAGLNIKFPANNTISTLSLAEKVKRVKNFVFYIECSK